MAIISSTYSVGHVQIDGRRYVSEQHTDSAGAVHTAEYLAEIGVNYQAIAEARAVAIAQTLADAEFEVIING